MTHEQLAKKFITNLYLSANGYVGPSQTDEIDDFFRNLKECIKKDVELTPHNKQLTDK